MRRLVPLVAMVALAVVACSAGGDSSAPPSTTAARRSTSTTTGGTAAGPPSTTSTSTTGGTTTLDKADPRAEVVKAYRAALAVDQALGAAPNENDPRLAGSYTGAAEDRLKQVLLGYRLKGWVGTYVGKRFDVTIEAVQMDGASSALLTACIVDGGVLLERSTGKAINDKLVTTEERARLLRGSDGRWRVAVRDTRAEWAGVAGCAA
ncbi:MAG: hypothetical protein HYX34_05370 [Actinobacteria bacterium]|nr:hypothetical protein [Actinomycetota bacterium]